MSKTIVLCCDGTGQRFEANKANPLRFHYCLKNSPSQISFYDPGVGTFDPDAGGHTDGWIDDIAASISKGALRWMIAQAHRHNVAFYPERVEEFVPDPEGIWHESLADAWVLRGAIPRTIAEGASIHRSAIRRREAVADYAPRNWPEDWIEVSA